MAAGRMPRATVARAFCPQPERCAASVGITTEYEALFEQAKKLEPEFFAFDLSHAHYLLPKGHGEAGDWEAAAEKKIERPGTAEHEIYARVVTAQAGHYDNIFKQSSASWRKARKGYEELLTRYPESKHLLNGYCRLACHAGHRKFAKELFFLRVTGSARLGRCLESPDRPGP